MTFRAQFRALVATFAILGFHWIGTAAPQQPAAAKATLQGVVKLARTGGPLAGARVTLTSATLSAQDMRANLPPIAAATTDSNGEFVLEGLDAGSYRFSVGNNGFVSYGSARVDLTAGQIVKDIVVLMKATGAISGRIGSSAGRPLPGVEVSLLRRIYNANGTPGFSSVATTKTNDLGEYRAFWVTPGRYYVSANGRGGPGFGLNDARYEFDNGVSQGVNEVSDSYPLTFFPGTADIAQASSIDLQEGMEIPNINFTLPGRQQFYSIRGRLIDASTGQAPANATIALSQASFTGNGGASWAARWYDPATGTFELPNLAPGRYGIVAQLGQGFAPLLGASVGTASVSMTVTIESSDIENLTLTLSPPSVITGRIKMEQPLPPATPVERLRVSLVSASSLSDSPIMGNPSTAVAADATFRMNSIAEGEFRVALSGLPPGFYLKEARLDDTDVMNTPKRFSVAGNLDVVISANGGQVSGRVLNEQARPVAGVEAVLIPNVSRNRSELFKRSVTGPDGRFTIASVTPGDYKLFAWEQLEAFSFFDADVLRKYENKGTAVHIAESSTETVDIKIIPEGPEGIVP